MTDRVREAVIAIPHGVTARTLSSRPRSAMAEISLLSKYGPDEMAKRFGSRCAASRSLLTTWL
jgi:hypothetical protein